MAANPTALSQGQHIHEDPMSSSILVVGIVCGVIVGLLIGWVTLEATHRARKRFSAWFRRKMGFKAKDEAQSQPGIATSDTAVWSAEENGYPTPKLDGKNFESAPPSIVETLAGPESSSGTIDQYLKGDKFQHPKETVSTLRTPEKVQSRTSSPASHYSYYNVDDLSTPKAQFAIPEGKTSLESNNSDATPTKGSYQAAAKVSTPAQTRLNRI